RPPPRGALPISRNLLERDVEDRVSLPTLVVEVPPLAGVDDESLLLHLGAQEVPAGALLRGAAGVARGGAVREFVVRAGHVRLFAGRDLVHREIHGRPPVVLGALRRVRDEAPLALLLRGDLPEVEAR